MWDDALHPTIKGPRHGMRWICYICGKTFGRKQCEVEHCDPVVDLRVPMEFMSWDMIYDRINNNKLEIVCSACHKKKSSSEATERARLRKEIKYLVCRRKGSGVYSEIKVFKIINIKKDLDKDVWEILSVWDTEQEANEDYTIRTTKPDGLVDVIV